MCLYELLLLQGGCAVLPQPHPEEAVVDDIAAIVLVDEFSIDRVGSEYPVYTRFDHPPYYIDRQRCQDS